MRLKHKFIQYTTVIMRVTVFACVLLAMCTGILDKKTPASSANRCMCPEMFRPMCGANGKTYSHGCLAACEKITIAHEGECEKAGSKLKPKTPASSANRCMCTEHLKPVCGTNGKTYSNECLAACEKIPVAHEGECEQKAGSKPKPKTK